MKKTNSRNGYQWPFSYQYAAKHFTFFSCFYSYTNPECAGEELMRLGGEYADLYERQLLEEELAAS